MIGHVAGTRAMVGLAMRKADLNHMWSGLGFALVGRTGFEPVTSSVSGNSRTVPDVSDRRTGSNGEPLTWATILTTSRYVRGRLNTLPPISAPGAGRRRPATAVETPPRDASCIA